MTNSPAEPSRRHYTASRRWTVAALLFGVAAFLLAASRINHGLADSRLPSGPGLTPDEPLYVSQGVYLFESLLDHGPAFFTPQAAQEVFGAKGYLPDHPPLGRMVLGCFHQCTSWMFATDDLVFNICAARLGSCFLFGLAVCLLFQFSQRRYGPVTAVAAAVVLMLMPRVVGHARLATLETITMLTWLMAMLPLLTWWTGPQPPTTRQSLISGILFGLLLLTKMQAVFLPPLIVAWAIWQFRLSAVRPLLIWGVTAGCLFLFGWPWLWLDPVEHVMQYLGRSTERPVLYVWYWAERYADRSVPWTYPWVMTLLTVPLTIPLLAGWRLFVQRWQADRVEQLAALSVAWPLLVFSLPGTPVYDGTRLFLVIMPLLALLCGGTIALLLNHLIAEWRQRKTGDTGFTWRSGVNMATAVAVPVTLLLSALNLGPFSLDSYNPLGQVIQSRAPDAPPFEACYWSDALNGDFWRQVPQNSTVMVAPVSHQFQLRDLQMMIPELTARNIQLVPFEYDPVLQKGLLLLNHRLADLRPSLRHPPEGARIIAEIKSKGTTLARLIDTSECVWTSVPDWTED
jgi:hypothetical protein